MAQRKSILDLIKEGKGLNAASSSSSSPLSSHPPPPPVSSNIFAPSHPSSTPLYFDIDGGSDDAKEAFGDDNNPSWPPGENPRERIVRRDAAPTQSKNLGKKGENFHAKKQQDPFVRPKNRALPCPAWSRAVLANKRGECTDGTHESHVCEQQGLHLTADQLSDWWDNFKASTDYPANVLGGKQLKILILGDTDFRLSVALVGRYAESLNLVATTFQTKPLVDASYTGKCRAAVLRTKGLLGIGYAVTPSELNITKISAKFGQFDCIVYADSVCHFEELARNDVTQKTWKASEFHSKDEQIFLFREICEATRYAVVSRMHPLLVNDQCRIQIVTKHMMFVDELHRVYPPKEGTPSPDDPAHVYRVPFDPLSLPFYYPSKRLEIMFWMFNLSKSYCQGYAYPPIEAREEYSEERTITEKVKKLGGEEKEHTVLLVPLPKGFFEELDIMFKGASAQFEVFGVPTELVKNVEITITPEQAQLEVDAEAADMKRRLERKRKAEASSSAGRSRRSGR